MRPAHLVFAALALQACGGASLPTDAGGSPSRQGAALPPDASTYFPAASWRSAEPEQVGIPASVLARVGQRVASGTWRGLDSFLVIRRGYMVHETYYGGSFR